MGANDVQIGGDHYKTDAGIQHWDVVEMFELGYMEGQITKYIFRWKKKDGLKDLLKAQHFLEKMIEIEKEKVKKKDAAEIFPTQIVNPFKAKIRNE